MKDKFLCRKLCLLELENSSVKAGTAAEGTEVNSRCASQRNHKPGKKEFETSVLELGSRAMTEATKDVKPPKSAYELETSWRGFSGDHGLETQLLKIGYISQCATANLQEFIVCSYASGHQ